MRRTSLRTGLHALPIATALLALGCSQQETWRLVWSDEFNSSSVDADDPDFPSPNSSKWNFEVSGSGFGNEQLEFDTSRPVNASLDGMGHLAITARAEAFGGNLYTSARINTAGKFEQQYGRFEARIQMPLGRGLWPAFWMLGADVAQVPWPGCGEVDIVEYRGQEPLLAHGSAHGPGYSGGEARTQTYSLPAPAPGSDAGDASVGFDAAFHVFTLEWEPGELRYYVDEILYEVVDATQLPIGTVWVYDHPFYILLNLAVGGDYLGPPDSSTIFPQTMLVDYVRVYEKAN